MKTKDAGPNNAYYQDPNLPHYHDSNMQRDLDLQLLLELDKRAKLFALIGDIACAVGIVALIATPMWLPGVMTMIFGE